MMLLGLWGFCAVEELVNLENSYYGHSTQLLQFYEGLQKERVANSEVLGYLKAVLARDALGKSNTLTYSTDTS